MRLADSSIGRHIACSFGEHIGVFERRHAGILETLSGLAREFSKSHRIQERLPTLPRLAGLLDFFHEELLIKECA